MSHRTRRVSMLVTLAVAAGSLVAEPQGALSAASPYDTDIGNQP